MADRDRGPDAPAAMLADLRLRRRAVLKAGSALLLQAALPLSACLGSSQPARTGPSVPPGFLSEAELRALRAFTDRMIPADADPGALAADCARAIDRLLGAFQSDPPFVYAGAPFSDRGGNPTNDFLRFVPLDDYEALGWRIELEGSLGMPEREFNGVVKGVQAIYREGLARLDELAAARGHADFASAPTAVQDEILRSGDPAVDELIDVGFPDTLEAMYGAPEYGGNRDLAGWGFTAYDGDVQPRGYTDEQVVNADNPGPYDPLLPPSYHDAAARPAQNATTPAARAPLEPAVPALPVAPPAESMLGLVQAAGGRLGALRRLLAGRGRG